MGERREKEGAVEGVRRGRGSLSSVAWRVREWDKELERGTCVGGSSNNTSSRYGSSLCWPVLSLLLLGGANLFPGVFWQQHMGRSGWNGPAPQLCVRCGGHRKYASEGRAGGERDEKENWLKE
jgi:hypothetical protein